MSENGSRAATGAHAASLIADKPRSCICQWTWVPDLARHILTWTAPGCPWHFGRRA